MYLIMWPIPEYIQDAIANWIIASSEAFLSNPVTSGIRVD
jgi:hypothetical protein